MNGALRVGFLGDSITAGVGDSGGPGCYDWALTDLALNGYAATGGNYGDTGTGIQEVILNYSPYIQSTAPAAWDGAADGRLQFLSGADQGALQRATILQGDGVHPSPQGHQDLGKLWAIGITAALGGTNTLAAPTGAPPVVTTPTTAYQSERWGTSTYTLPGLTPGASYALRLHFAEVYWTNAVMHLFNVAANGQSLLTGFDIFAAAGGTNKAVAKTFTVAADKDGKVTLTFAGAPGSPDPNAKISGIELLPH